MSAEIPAAEYSELDAFYGMLIHEHTKHDAHSWNLTIGENNRVAIVTYDPYENDDPVVRIVKVPRNAGTAYRNGRAEIASLRLLAATDPPPPFEVPTVDRVEEDFFYSEPDPVIKGSFYSVLTPVRGLVMNSHEELSTTEAQNIGRATASLAMWEENIDMGRFNEKVESKYGKCWDWQIFFATLDFSNRDFPSLSLAASSMRTLRNQYYPSDRSPSLDTQVIHGDLRPPNLTLGGDPGERVVCGVPDWGSARRGSRAEECRSLWEVGRGAIEAANDEFEVNHRPSVDPEEVRFWFVGRFVVALIRQLQDGISSPDAYLRARSVIQRELPEYAWSELPDVASPAYYDGERRHLPNFNGIPWMEIV